MLSVVGARDNVRGLPGGEGWYLPTLDGAGELFVFELGLGDAVVVLHGGPGADLSYLLPVANGLESEFRFVFYHQRGSLRSRVTSDSISMAKHIEDLETLRETLGLERDSSRSRRAADGIIENVGHPILMWEADYCPE